MPNYYKTDVPCDGVQIIIDQNAGGYGSPPAVASVAETGTIILTGSPATLTAPEYVVGADNITVFKMRDGFSPDDWGQLVLDVDYTEVKSIGTHLSTIISITDPTGTFKIVRKQGKLVEDVHYTRVNSHIIEFNEDPASYNIIKIYTVNPAKSKLNPAKIIDDESEVVITNVAVWDPARGDHYHQAIHVIDLQRGDPLDPDVSDPALYNVPVNPALESLQPWAENKVGTTWFDTTTLGYVPYYDDKVYPNIDDRLFHWGALSSWASINFYQWTQSDVLPEEYDAIAAVQENDTTIDKSIRVTGTAKATPYVRTRDTYTFTTSVETQGVQTVLLDETVYGTTVASDFTGLGNNFAESFVASESAGSPVGETFTLTEGFYVGSANLRVTVNGVLVTPTSYDSTTSFTLADSDITATDTVLATITAPVYSTQITVDGGTPQNVIINGSLVQNFGQLIDAINDDITGATAVLNGNQIDITSDSSGASSIILIDDEFNSNQKLQLFGNLINILGGGSPTIIASTKVDGTDSVATSVGHPFIVGDSVIVSTTDTLPAPLTNTTYTVTNVIAGSPSTDFNLIDSEGTTVVFTDTGTGVHSIVDAVWTTNWIEEVSVHEIVDVACVDGLIGTRGPITLSNFAIGDTVDVYVNEFLLESLVVGSGSPIALNITLTSYLLQKQDTVRVIKPAHVITEEDESFDPDVADDGTTNTQYKNFYDYTQITTFAEDGITPVNTYYFWVGDKSVATLPNSALTLRDAARELQTIPIPYIMFDNLKYQSLAEDTFIRLPLRYDQMVLRGHTGLINADDRYVLRFTRDLTLRDRFENKESQPRLKNVHTEWELFREAQQTNPPRTLWDSITEAMAGYTLADPTVRVPARERELYDETYGTDTQYGLDEGQIFVDGDIALATVLDYLLDPDIDFFPTDIQVFFDNYSFDTAENRVDAMNYIYNNFAFNHVNAILHSVLLDAFAAKSKYPELFKTSMVSLHGIKLLETAGLFDD